LIGGIGKNVAIRLEGPCAIAFARRAATETLNEGTYTAMTTNMLSDGDVNRLFSKA